MIGNQSIELSLFEFQYQFSICKVCMKYLSFLKCGSGFECKKCKHIYYCKGVRDFDIQCTRCFSI